VLLRIKIIKEFFMKKFINRVFDWIVFLLSGKGVIADEGISADILDYSGQGRSKNGR
jgi:hypothetical protein